MARVLGLARQSSTDTGAGTLETQRVLITDACEDRDDELVFIVEDQQSGKLGAFSKIRNSSAWFSDPEKLASYDTVMVSARDRLDRDVRSRQDFLDWLKDHNKTAVTTSGSVIRAATADEWLSETSASVSAHHYRLIVGEKRADRARILRKQGKLGYGSWAVPYGFRRGDDGKPQIIPEEAETINRMCDLILTGMTLSDVARTLITEGAKTRRDGPWSVGAISKIIKRLDVPYARSGDGVPFYFPEIVPPDRLSQVRSRLADRSFRKARKTSTSRHDSMLLSGFAVCKNGHPLYALRFPDGRSYYRCQIDKLVIPMAKLDALAAEFVDATAGTTPYAETVHVAGSTHLPELSDLIRRIEDIESQLMDPSSNASAKVFEKVLTRLSARREELEALPVVEAHTELRKTGKTVSEEWESADKNKKRRILGEIGAKLTVWAEDGKLRVTGESVAVLGWSYTED